MKIIATPLVTGAGIALTSDDQSITVMLRPGEVHTVSDAMRSAKSVRHAITLGFITVQMDSTTSDNYLLPHSDFVAQVELNALATYVSSMSGFSGLPGTKFIFLDIHGGADTAEILLINGTPYLVFKNGEDNRSAWTTSVPNDYIAGTPINVEVFWSPNLSVPGNVNWLFEYKSISPGGNVSVPITSFQYVQASPGVSSNLITTGTHLSIASTNANDLLTVSIRRDATNLIDTLPAYAQVHLVRISYTGIGASGTWSGTTVSGCSGYSGYSGMVGSGISGYSGYSSFSGYSGYSGISGFSGYSGYSGISGFSGYGTSGYSGYSGTGISGTSGVSGYSGYGNNMFHPFLLVGA